MAHLRVRLVGLVLLGLCGVLGVWCVGMYREVQRREKAEWRKRNGREAGLERVYRVGDAEYKMRWIPAGEFLMGSPAGGGDSDEKPQHKVLISRGYWMMEHEVTQGQWKAAMGGMNPSHFSSCGVQCPVRRVSWHEAAAFANKLSEAQRLEACFVCEGKGADRKCEGKGNKESEYVGCKGWRLPTEAEWEYAARAGTTTSFHTGKCISTTEANYDGNNPQEGCAKGEYRMKTIEVCSLARNAWGLCDMHGNVWEWVYDAWNHSAYKGRSMRTATRDPVYARQPSLRVNRGGSWNYNAWSVRSANRDRFTPTNRYDDLGFRLVRFE